MPYNQRKSVRSLFSSTSGVPDLQFLIFSNLSLSHPSSNLSPMSYSSQHPTGRKTFLPSSRRTAKINTLAKLTPMVFGEERLREISKRTVHSVLERVERHFRASAHGVQLTNEQRVRLHNQYGAALVRARRHTRRLSALAFLHRRTQHFSYISNLIHGAVLKAAGIVSTSSAPPPPPDDSSYNAELQDLINDPRVKAIPLAVTSLLHQGCGDAILELAKSTFNVTSLEAVCLPTVYHSVKNTHTTSSP